MRNTNKWKMFEQIANKCIVDWRRHMVHSEANEVVKIPRTDAQKRAKKKYETKAYDRLVVLVKKGQKDKYKECAMIHGESLAAFVSRVLDEAIERDEPTTAELERIENEENA